MRLFVLSCLILVSTQPCFAEAPQPLVVRATFSAASATVAPPPVYQRAVTPQEIERWKNELVSYLRNSEVRDVLTGYEGTQFLKTVDTSLKGDSQLLRQLTDFAREKTLDIHLGLFDTISLESLKREHQISGPFSVDFTVPRTEFKLAIKEVLYTAGYLDGLGDLLSAALRAHTPADVKLGTRAIVKRAASLKVAVNSFRKASDFLITGKLKDLDEKDYMEEVGPAVDKYLTDELETWARLFCVTTER